MSTKSRLTARVCSVTDALAAFGDRYSLPLVREIFYGNRRFSDLVDLLGAPRTLLADRLRRLERLRVISRRRYSVRPPRDEYVLTKAGANLLPVLIALKEWGDRYGGNKKPSQRLAFGHRCGQPLVTATVCRECRKEVRFEDLVVTGDLRPVRRAAAPRSRNRMIRGR